MHVTPAIEIGLRTARRRLLTIASLVIAVAVAVGVLTATLAIPRSFAQTATRIVDPDRRIVWQDNAPTQELSTIARDIALRSIEYLQIRRGPSGEVLASTEVTRNLPFLDPRTGENAMLSVRGLTLPVTNVRPEVQILSGRFPQARAREAIVGRGLAVRTGLSTGNTIEMIDGKWEIVGVFSSGGDAHESELFVDVDALMGAMRLNNFNAVVYLPTQSAPSTRAETQGLLNAGIKTWVVPEAQVITLTYDLYVRVMNSIAYSIGAMIIVALLIGILITFLIAVRKRSSELATLRALGFDRGSLVMTVIIEAVLCVFAGGLVGLLGVKWLLERTQISLFSGMAFSELTFDMTVSGRPVLIALATTLIIAILVAMVGGMQASSVTPARTLRRA